VSGEFAMNMARARACTLDIAVRNPNESHSGVNFMELSCFMRLAMETYIVDSMHSSSCWSAISFTFSIFCKQKGVIPCIIFFLSGSNRN